MFGNDQATKAFVGCDIVLHLTAVNNDVAEDPQVFQVINVDFAVEMAKAAQNAGVKLFVNFSSIHALDDGPNTPYAHSKRTGIQALNLIEGMSIYHLFLPLVYGGLYGGRLSWLNRVPKLLSRPIFTCLAALKPAVHVQRLAQWIQVQCENPQAGSSIVSNCQEGNLVYHGVRGIALEV